MKYGVSTLKNIDLNVKSLENGMNEDYLISIKGKQETDGETGEVELTTVGSYIQKGNSRYILYKEYTEAKGKPGTSILKIEGNSKVTLIRGDGDNTRLILEKGKRHLCQYDTGYGSLMIGVFTSRVHSDLGDVGGRLELSYTLDVNSSLSSRNDLFITVREAKGKDVKDRITG